MKRFVIDACTYTHKYNGTAKFKVLLNNRNCSQTFIHSSCCKVDHREGFVFLQYPCPYLQLLFLSLPIWWQREHSPSEPDAKQSQATDGFKHHKSSSVTLRKDYAGRRPAKIRAERQMIESESPCRKERVREGGCDGICKENSRSEECIHDYNSTVVSGGGGSSGVSGAAEKLEMCINVARVWPGSKPSTLSQPVKARILCSQIPELLLDSGYNPALHTWAA